MTITREDVLHIARLAEIAVEDADVPALTEQLDRIVGYVAQLEDARLDESADGGSDLATAGPHALPPDFVPGPMKVGLREDVVSPEPLAVPPDRLAPVWKDGYFVVPRLPGWEEG